MHITIFCHKLTSNMDERVKITNILKIEGQNQTFIS